jgi:hypothetical protein
MATVYQLGLGRFGLTAGHHYLSIIISLSHVEYGWKDSETCWAQLDPPGLFLGVIGLVYGSRHFVSVWLGGLLDAALALALVYERPFRPSALLLMDDDPS